MPSDQELAAQSVAAIKEKPMVRGLFNHPNCSDLLLRQLGMNGVVTVHFEIESPVLNGERRGPGDVDALLYREGEMESTIAIEFERVRIAPSAFQTEMVGTSLRHGVAQANLLKEAGYWKPYLGMIVQIDGRERTAFNFMGRGLTVELLKLINAFEGRDRLAPGVGLLFAEVVQPVDKDFWLAGGIGVSIGIAPSPQVQPPELTQWIQQLHQSELRSSARN